MNNIIAIIITTILYIIVKNNKEYYNKIIFIVLFGVLLLGERAINYYPFTLSIFLPPFTILIIYMIYTIHISKYKNNINVYKITPNFKVIMLFVIVLMIGEIRAFTEIYDVSFFEPNDGIFRFNYFIKFTFPAVIYFILISARNSSNFPERYIKILNITALFTAIITITLYMFHLNIDGAIVTSSRRIIWGGLGAWLPSIIIINILTLNSKLVKNKLFSFLIIFFGLIVIYISQTRNMLIFLFLPLLIIFINRGTKTHIKMILFAVLIIIPLIFYADVYGVNIQFGRFTTYNDVVFESTDDLNPETFDQAPHKLQPLLWSIFETKNISDFMFGHGLGFREYSGRTHYHSGLGYVYGSLGIIGVLVLFFILFRTVKYYRKFTKYYHDINTVIIEVLLAQLITSFIISPITGTLIQGYTLFGHAFTLGMLEICRRNIINKKHSEVARYEN